MRRTSGHLLLPFAAALGLATLASTAACTHVLGDFSIGVKGNGGGGTGDDDGDGSACTNCTSGDDGGLGDDGSAGDDGGANSVALAISPTSAMLSRGDMIQVAVDLSGPLTFAVDILLATAPLGVTADPLRFEPGTTSGTLTIHVGLAAAAGASTITVAARAPGRVTPVVDAGTPTVADAAIDAAAAPPDAAAADASTPKADAGTGTGTTTVGGVLPGDITATFALTVEGMNGGPDPTFGTGGVLVIHVSAGSDVPLGLAFDSKGQVIVVGTRGTPASMVLARITEAGAQDMTYGTAGLAAITTLATAHSGTALSLRSDDGVYAAGSVSGGAGSNALLASFTSAGQLDTTFSAGRGYVSIDSGSTDAVNAVTVSGATVVVGGQRTLGTNVQGLLLGFSTAGVFGGQVTSPGAIPTSVGSLISNGATGYWIGGLTASGGAGNPFDSLALGRGAPGGAQFDTTFGTDGFASNVNSGSSFGSAPYAVGRVALQSTGRLVVAGTPVAGACVLAGFTPSGAADATFGVAGTASSTMGSGDDIVADGADRLIVVGSDFGLQRFLPNGAPDDSFNDALPATPVFVSSEATRAAVDAKGRLVVIGKGAVTAGDDDWVVARFLP